MDTSTKDGCKDEVPHVEKSIADETSNAGLSSEDQAFLDNFPPDQTTKIYRKVSHVFLVAWQSISNTERSSTGVWSPH